MNRVDAVLMEMLFLSFQGQQHKRLWDFGGFMDINHLRYSEGPGLQGLSSSIYTAVGQKGQKRRTGSREGLRFNRGKTRRCWCFPRTQLLLVARTLPLFHSVCSDHIVPLKKERFRHFHLSKESFFFSEHRGRKHACPEDNTMHQKYPTCIHLAREHVQVRMFLRLEVGGSYTTRSPLWLSSAASCPGQTDVLWCSWMQ